jgi:hypothetical protein
MRDNRLEIPDIQNKRTITVRWFVVGAFAIAMAWVESAVVFYLRTLVDRIQPYQNIPLPTAAGLERAELVREAATLLMLLTVGWLAGRNWRTRFGYAAIAFGIWDIFYYLFLRVMTGWPKSIFDWDILFLLESDDRLAEIDFRLGHSVSLAIALVGTGLVARLHRAADDSLGDSGAN